jgi:hypothetical protein
MLESDFLKLPPHTRRFVERIHRDGLDRVRVHGVFVLLGLYAGTPDTKENIDELFKTLNFVVPVDRTKNIDEVVGHIYDGYDREISEFCYRSGAELEFREIKIPDVEKSFYVVDLRNHGLFDVDIMSIEKLADAFNLCDAFILAGGQSTARRQASLVEAFSCGVMQTQLNARIDVGGSRQIAQLLRSYLPLTYAQYFSTLRSNGIEYFLGLERGQVPLLSLMQPMDLEYARQMWAFQSRLFYRDQKPLDGVDDWSIREWHSWVIHNAQKFDSDYPRGLVSFSQSQIDLIDVPLWPADVEMFETCDTYIEDAWGYSASSIDGGMEVFEYKALMVHLVYASLTCARD